MEAVWCSQGRSRTDEGGHEMRRAAGHTERLSHSQLALAPSMLRLPILAEISIGCCYRKCATHAAATTACAIATWPASLG